MDNSGSLLIGIVSDTHIPDRVDNFHPALLSSLCEQGVQAIFHAGDISTPSVLASLEKIAPVTAVRGNRDWLFRNTLPTLQKLTFFGVKIALLHGHINFSSYIQDKFYHITRGYNFDRYQPRLLAAWPEAQVIIYGHTHQPETLHVGNRLLFSPGSCTTKSLKSRYPHYGLLRIFPDGKVETSTICLTGYTIQLHQWVKES